MGIHAVGDSFGRASYYVAPKSAKGAAHASAEPVAPQPVGSARQGTKRKYEQGELQPASQPPRDVRLWWPRGHYWWPIENRMFHYRQQTGYWPERWLVCEWYTLWAVADWLPAAAPCFDAFIAHVAWVVERVETLVAGVDLETHVVRLFMYEPSPSTPPPGLYDCLPETCAHLQPAHACHVVPGSSRQPQAASAPGLNRAGAMPSLPRGTVPTARAQAPATSPAAGRQGSGWGAVAATHALLHADGSAEGHFAAHLPYQRPVPQMELAAQQAASRCHKVARTSACPGASVAKPSSGGLPPVAWTPQPAAVSTAAAQRQPLAPIQPGNACSSSGRPNAGRTQHGGGWAQRAGHPMQKDSEQAQYGNQQMQHGGQQAQHAGQRAPHGRNQLQAAKASSSGAAGIVGPAPAAAAGAQPPPTAAPVKRAASRQAASRRVTPATYGPLFCGSDDAAAELTGGLWEQLIADIAEAVRGPLVQPPAQQPAQGPTSSPLDLPAGFESMFVASLDADDLTGEWLDGLLA